MGDKMNDFKQIEKEFHERKKVQDLELKIIKAQSAIKQLTLDIEEKRFDIKRIEHHIGLQENIIAESKEKLNELTQ
jgi:hypothetical protein